MKKHLIKIIPILLLSPTILFAQGSVTDLSGLGNFIDNIKNNVIVNLSALFLTTAVVAFFYGIVKYLFAMRDGDATEINKGKQVMLWGLIALFVMFSIWGLVKFSQRLLGIEGQTTIQIPSIRFDDSGSGGEYSVPYRGTLKASVNVGGVNLSSDDVGGLWGKATDFFSGGDKPATGQKTNTSPVVQQVQLLPSGSSCYVSSQCASGLCLYDAGTLSNKCN